MEKSYSFVAYTSWALSLLHIDNIRIWKWSYSVFCKKERHDDEEVKVESSHKKHVQIRKTL
jgi:hypothetical protein